MIPQIRATITMGGLGSDMAIANADLVLMNDDPSKVLTAITIAHKTETSARVNIIVALAIKLGVMITSLVWTGFPLWAAVLADTGLTVLLVLNSLALNFAKIRNR